MIWGKRGWFCMLSGSSYPCISHTLRWRHNMHDSVSNRQPHDCLLNRLFRRRSKKTSKLRVTGLCAGNSPGTGEFPAQMASYAENVSIWWRHHAAFALLVPDWLHYHWHLSDILDTPMQEIMPHVGKAGIKNIILITFINIFSTQSKQSAIKCDCGTDLLYVNMTSLWY